MLPAWFSVGFLAFQTPCVPPTTTLISSFPFGKQLSMAVSADNTTAFVADGASISILGIASQTLTANVLVPECQPLAQLHWVSTSGDKYLFIAGGGLGLWRISLPQTGSPIPQRIYESVGQSGAGKFQRKRCVAVAILDNNPSGGIPVLFALFAASSDPLKSNVGARELRAYQLSGSSVIDIPSTFTFPNTVAGSRDTVGTSLAVDPANSGSVWVGMGKGGLWRADLDATLLLTCAHINDPWPDPSLVNYVKDIAIVRVPSLSKSFLYAALNLTDAISMHGKIAEYDLANATAPHIVEASCSHPTRISAVTKNTKVLVAVAEDHVSVPLSETQAPFEINGIWDGACIGPGFGDSDDHSDQNHTPDC